MLLLLLFIVVPLIEIGLFIQVGDLIGLWPTLGAVILTAVIGTALLRAQGFAALRRAQEELDRGGLPLGAVFDGACLLIAGALLLTPGFLTDTIGFLLFVPGFRRSLGAALWRYLQSRGDVHVSAHATFHASRRDDRVIDGEFEEVDDAPESQESRESRPGSSDSPWRRLP